MDCNYRLHSVFYTHLNGIMKSAKSTIYRYDNSGLLLSTISISGDISDKIDEAKFIYGDNGLLYSTESNRFITNYEYDELGNLKMSICFDKKSYKYFYWVYEYNEKQKIKQSRYNHDNIFRLALRFEYDYHGVDISNVYPYTLESHEYYGHREYDDRGLMKKYYMKDDVIKDNVIVNFIWENKFSNYNWEMFYNF